MEKLLNPKLLTTQDPTNPSGYIVLLTKSSMNVETFMFPWLRIQKSKFILIDVVQLLNSANWVGMECGGRWEAINQVNRFLVASMECQKKQK